MRSRSHALAPGVGSDLALRKICGELAGWDGSDPEWRPCVEWEVDPPIDPPAATVFERHRQRVGGDAAQGRG